MSKSDSLETSLLKLIFNGLAISNIADNAAASPSTSIWVALHTADPGDSGTMATSEASFTGYARTATARTTGATGWSVTNGSASPNSAITFPQATSTSTGTITHFSVGLSSAGASAILYSGTVTPNINYGQNVTPSLSTGSAITED